MSHDVSQSDPESLDAIHWRTEPLELRFTESWERLAPPAPSNGIWGPATILNSAPYNGSCLAVTVWLGDRPLLSQPLHRRVVRAFIHARMLDEPVPVSMFSEIVPSGERTFLKVKAAAPAGSDRAFRAMLNLATRTDLPTPGVRFIAPRDRPLLLYLGHTWRECTAVWGSLTPEDGTEYLDALTTISRVAFRDLLWGDPAQEVERLLAGISGIGGLAPGR